ncbi:hypothetical protein CRE_14571 [Caenorhabditis remanei]|uniref:NTF2-like domain-containing protein n=1 Tax=Caenorhabditis remanei TaxID=31234 RepID=E3M9K5_CAERE|nr:hypothetical protein CRE_14571 [Caenorhabditis remanei]
MFNRWVFLLLLVSVAFTETSKVHDVLKTVGKRFGSVLGLPDRNNQKPQYFGVYVSDADTYGTLTEQAVLELKNKTAFEVMTQFIVASSASNAGFKQALVLLAKRMLPDFVAEVCRKKMNKYQYLKYLTQNAALYFPTDNYKEAYNISKTDRYSNVFNFDIYQRDTMAVDTRIEFDIIMNATYHYGQIFHISYIHQGGLCPDIGKVSHSSRNSFDLIIDDVEGINEHNRTKMFLDLFTPQPWQYEHYHPNDLPTTWMYRFNKDETKVYVCQEGVMDVVEYTISQFDSWYFHFGTMWHPDAKMETSEAFKLSITLFKDYDIVGRSTMKLQMGVSPDASIREWNFKFQARRRGEENWIIDRVEVPCNPEVKYKDESLVAIRDIVAKKFVDYVEERNATQWYSTIDFVKEFTKKGKVDFVYCDAGAVSKSYQLILFTHDKGQLHSTKFTKYWMDKSDVPTPAPDTYEFRFKTMSEAASANPEFEYEHEWTIHFEWDQMDQFYHIDKIEMGCGKEFKDGEALAADYLIFNLGGKK